MGKGAGIVIFGIVLSIAGAATAAVCGKKAYDDYKKYDKYKSGEFTLKESNKITLDAAAGTMNVHRSETGTSYVKYNVLEMYDVKYDEEENEVKMKRKWMWNFVVFSWASTSKSTVDVYLTDKEYDAYFELSAGEFNVEDDFTFSSLTINVSAGTFNYKKDMTVNDDANIRISAGDLNIDGKTTVNDDANIRISAGDLTIKNLEAKHVDVRVSAGDATLSRVTSDDIKFKISAGDLNMNIVGNKLDYTIDIDKSAGECNVKDNEGGSKKLDGKISAGSATINFID